MDDERRVYRLSRTSMRHLIKRVSDPCLKGDFLELPEAEEIDDRLPDDLKLWYAHVLYTLREPWRLRCGPIDRSDEGYFEIFRLKRDRDHPETNPNYKPPRKGWGGDDGGDGGDGDAGVPPPSM